VPNSIAGQGGFFLHPFQKDISQAVVKLLGINDFPNLLVGWCFLIAEIKKSTTQN